MGINTEKMTTTPYHQIQDILAQKLAEVGQDASDLKLRPPKEAVWGDLSSNILQILGDNEDATQSIVAALENLPDVAAVAISANRYVNISFEPTYWTEQITLLAEAGMKYGWPDQALDLKLEVPAGDADLMALKRRWTAESLVNLTRALGGQATIIETAEQEKAGFNAKAALARCPEQTLRLSLLTHNDDFVIHFSPMKALERSYDQPAFLLPYTYATVRRLLRENAPDGEGDHSLIPLDITFSGAEELALARHLVGWPQILHKSLSEQSLVNLTGFLTEASLLFFKLYRAERLQSSDYLTHGACAALRREQLNALAHLLGDVLEALEHDRVEEFI